MSEPPNDPPEEESETDEELMGDESYDEEFDQDYDEFEGEDSDYPGRGKDWDDDVEPQEERRPTVEPPTPAELNRMKVLKIKQEREARRTSLDNHHQYIIDFIAFYLDQKPKEIEEFVIDTQDNLNLMESFFKIDGSRALMFYYQEHEAPGPETGRTAVPAVPGAKKEKIKRLMLTGGADLPMQGLLLYFLRPNTTEPISAKNVSDEIYLAMVTNQNFEEPGIVLNTMNDMLQAIYLKNLRGNTSWVTVPDEDMATKIKHRFLTAISYYSGFLTDCKNDIASRLDLIEISNFDDIPELKTTDDIIHAAKNPEIVQRVEHEVIFWCKSIERCLATSKQMRKETDSMGPLAELAYWRNLMAKMCYIIQQTQEPQMVNMIQILMFAKSRVLRRWKDVDSRVSDEYHESRDNVRYMYALEKFCQPLYQHDPPGQIEHINSMMYVIRTIHTTSRYYNTCEKVTALMVKISNQMVAACRKYLTDDGTVSIWDVDSFKMVKMLNSCLELYEEYRGSYEATKKELENNPDGKRFDVSVNHIFGRFEKFCDRLKKIIKILEIFNMYGPIHVSRIDGLEPFSVRLKELQASIILSETYDPLEFRKPDFDEDFIIIRGAIDEIQTDLEKFFDASIEACPTVMHGLRLLERFQRLENRCLDTEGKLWYLFQFYHNEILLIQQIYEGEKNETPTPRGYPPFAGKIAWSRHLYRRLERPMKWFEEKTDVLQREGVTPTIKLFNSVTKKLIFYEILFHESWQNQCNSIYDALEAPILTLRGTMRQELVLNFDPFFRQIIEETEIIRKLELEVPDIAQVVYCKKDKIYATYERIKALLERFLKMKTQIPQDLAMLMRPITKKVEKAFMPGVTNINWTSFKTDEYFNYIEAHQNELEETIRKVQEIVTLRINQIVYEISHTMLLDIPEEYPITPEEFMSGVQKYGQMVAKELEYKSRVCEHAVGELIVNLLTSCDLPVPDDPTLTWLTSNGPPPIPTENKDKSKKDQQQKDKTKPLVDPTLAAVAMPKEEMIHIYEECRHVFAWYNQKFIDALQKATRISLDMLRSRTEEPQISKRNPGKILNRVPLFTADLVLTIPSITLKPTLVEMQQVLVRGIQLICESLKRVILWGQHRRYSFVPDTDSPYYVDALLQDPDRQESKEETKYERLQQADAYLRHSVQMETVNAKLKNCFKFVMEHKDVSKLVLMMQTVVVQAKPRVQLIIGQYMHYQFLWKETRDEEVATKITEHPVITEIEAIMRTYKELSEEIDEIPGSHRAGPLEVRTAEMKLGFQVETKEWRLSYCRQLSLKYKAVVSQMQKFIDECNKELVIPIKDMNDLYAVMQTLIKIRENIFKYESTLQPVEECYSFLKEQSYKVADDEALRAKNLRENYRKLLVKSIQTQEKIGKTQAKNRETLIEQVGKFQEDLKSYMDRYELKGPMKDGLTVEQGTERLYTFQDECDDLWERFTMCLSGEKLFGFTRNYYPELAVVRKQLSLLQKLYALFNDVLRSLNTYSDLRWKDVDMNKVLEDMDTYQARCNRLPRALQDFKPYKVLKTKVEALNEWCPVVVLLINKGMKDRHWEKLTKVTGFHFDTGHATFTLKVIMEVADKLLKYKTEIEQICQQAIKEKEIEDKMKQLELMNDF